MKKIPLTQGKHALVDNKDYKWLKRRKWYAYQDRSAWYARHNSRLSVGKQLSILMHREILGLKRGDKRQCDHVDGNGLNNQRSNLRICTAQQNTFNRKTMMGKSSKFKGVFWREKAKRWTVKITHEGKVIHLGSFVNELDAVRAYDKKAVELFGDFARPNLTIPDSQSDISERAYSVKSSTGHIPDGGSDGFDPEDIPPLEEPDGSVSSDQLINDEPE